ncbi:MAG TPA: DNA-directed RNA polymerase subunit A' [Candidatus Nanoarchaeia archaeon]|nr:DNA-directed RNA polymerase subunit A' [Candidatus Nanoarchaeia archaeon]
MNKPVRKRINEIKFALLSPEKIKKLSSAKVVTPELYDIDGYPVDGGLMDLRMGAVDPGVRCRTCGGRIKECLGHPGRIELARPVIHLKYIPLIEMNLRSFCTKCGKLKLSDKELEKYSPSERAKKAKDKKKCPHCDAEQEKIKLEKPSNFYRGRKRMFPIEIRDILEKIPNEELEKVGVNPKTVRPEWAILTNLLVPPVTVRPSIILESGERSEDDLTHKLSDIIRANQRLWENLNAGAPEVIIEDLWDLLQFHITTFFDNSVTRIPPARHRSGQPLKTITERIKGKEGRIRKNMAGKRVNFSGRSVISPEPYMEINELGVPYDIAKVVTMAERVNDLNIEKMKKLISNNEVYPGANYIIRPDGKRKKITEELKEEIINEIGPGYKVERHLQDGDIVLFNRHPSLHKGSLMAHFAKILPGKTFKMHLSACPPYNADFDGDEMNVHALQTEEARAEAKILLDVKQNIFSPKNNENLTGIEEDAVTGNYILGNEKLSRQEALQLLYKSGVETSISKKNIDGKEIFSKILPKVDFKNDSFTIKNGKLEDGIIDETTFGEGEGELLKKLDKDFGRDVAFETMKKAFDLGKNFLTNHGLSTSANDFDISEDVRKKGEEIIKKAEKKTQEIIKSYHDGTLEKLPGKSLEESREIKILQTLNESRTKVGDIVKKEFPENNPVNHMIKSGGKGNILNITQMASCVGQQAFSGGRVDIGYSERTLSFFKKNDLSPEARGFVKNSLIRGMRPDEFFFHSITGRDSLMDTALRTPKSGYLYRRLANALQDIKVEYDTSVRDSNNNIIQFIYGEDGLDVSKLHKKGKIDPGESIGIITAQSFGEASTQMVLNTFHMAGVAEMQVTTGLPRLIEIFDARKKLSSPKMEVFLNKEHNNAEGAKRMAEKIREVKLKELSSEISTDLSEKKIEIKLDKKGLDETDTTTKEVVDRLKKLNYKINESRGKITMDASELGYKEIYKTKEKLKEVSISGIKNIEQVLVVKRGKDYAIATLGNNLKDVIKLEEVNPNKTFSNDPYEVENVFGIEAARELIISEIQEVLDTQGLDIDKKHSLLIADTMTNSGTVRGITRMGIIAQKSSILARATFETPVRQFVNSTIKGDREKLRSVIENIILNQPVPVGTGLPGLLVKVIGPLKKENSLLKTADSKTVEKTNK